MGGLSVSLEAPPPKKCCYCPPPPEMQTRQNQTLGRQLHGFYSRGHHVTVRKPRCLGGRPQRPHTHSLMPGLALAPSLCSCNALQRRAGSGGGGSQGRLCLDPPAQRFLHPVADDPGFLAAGLPHGGRVCRVGAPVGTPSRALGEAGGTLRARPQASQPPDPQRSLPEIEVVGAPLDEHGRQRGAQVLQHLQRPTRPVSRTALAQGKGKGDPKGGLCWSTHPAACPGVQLPVGEDDVAGGSQI